MTYLSRGTQFVVVAVGGAGLPAQLVALSVNSTPTAARAPRAAHSRGTPGRPQTRDERHDREDRHRPQHHRGIERSDAVQLRGNDAAQRYGSSDAAGKAEGDERQPFVQHQQEDAARVAPEGKPIPISRARWLTW